MKLVATLMVRDEIDIIAATIEHHLDQGVDLIIATDNGSLDGTRQVLQKYADLGRVELHDDPVHHKQQGTTVTRMARRAHIEHGADWVLNIDADEFWVPVDKNLTLRQALEKIPMSLNAFQVPVTNLVGPPAERGGGIGRLTWRDHRTVESLLAIGIHAHPTDNVVHRGDPEVVVAQGNHFVNIKSTGQPGSGLAIETLHLPWRSWAQLQQKVVHAGLSYANNPNLRPSPKHHGMADYRRHLAGRLRPIWSLRHPSLEELIAGEYAGEYRQDLWLRDHILGLVDRALLPDELRRVLDADEQAVDPTAHRAASELGRQFVELERERDEFRALAEEHRQEAQRWRRRANRQRQRTGAAKRQPQRRRMPVRAALRRSAKLLPSGPRRRLRAWVRMKIRPTATGHARPAGSKPAGEKRATPKAAGAKPNQAPKQVAPAYQPTPEERLALRRECVFASTGPKVRILEIGAAHNGIAPKRDGYDTVIADYLDRDGLVAKYASFPQYSPDDIEDVDLILSPDSPMHELTGEKFGVVLASHVLEHTVSLIHFLQDAAELLDENGVLALVVPDKRYTFDRFRERTSIGRVIDTFHHPPPVHTKGTLTEFGLLAVKHRGSTSWVRNHRGKYSWVHDAGQARAKADLADSGSYVDVHNWVVSPNQCRLLLHDLAELGYISLRETFFRDTVGHEFFLNLSRTGSGPGMSRDDLQVLADSELRDLDVPRFEAAAPTPSGAATEDI